MTVEELAERFPRVFHVCEPGAHRLIARLGLLSAQSLLDRFDIGGGRCDVLLTNRRTSGVTITHPTHGSAVLNDNLPLSETALRNCLDDELRPADWLRLLNARVFLWPTERRLALLLAARVNRDRARDVLVFDTAKLLAPRWEAVSLSPINSGSTIRRPARRGLATFTRANGIAYRDWQRLRGGLDTVAEITVDDGLPDAAQALLDIRTVSKRQR